MRWLSVFLVSLCLSVASFAGDDFVVPKHTITGVDKPVPRGDIVDLGITPPDSAPKDVVAVSEVWQAFDVSNDGLVERRVREYLTPDGKRGVFFPAGIQPKKVFVTVAVTYLFAEKVDGKVTKVAAKTVVLNATVIIGDPPKPPDPPKPEPQPDIPEGQFGLAKTVRNAIVAHTSPATRKSWVAVHVTAYRGVIAAANAGTIKDLRDFLVQTQKAVAAGKAEAGLKDDAGWSKVADVVEEKLFSLYQSKRINTVDDIKAAIGELILGMEATK